MFHQELQSDGTCKLYCDSDHGNDGYHVSSNKVGDRT